MSAATDFKGRQIVTDKHYSNCLLYALKTWKRLGGVFRIRPKPFHVAVAADGYVHEFVYGLNEPKQRVWFKGYGVRTKEKVPESEQGGELK